MTLIKLEDVGLKFRVRRAGKAQLKDFLLHGLFRRSKQTSFEVQALEHIDLEVGEGDRLGIIGHNGAGKSTLLKLLAGVYPPTSGRRKVVGQIGALFDIALGFEVDANGWENIMYRGYLQGETPRSIREKIASIAEFSELGNFLNMPVRYYSSGMKVRLAFSIATSIAPDILIVDEILSAGDMAFQKKARERMKTLMSSALAVVVVSHDMKSLALMCDRVLWLDHGKTRMIGPAEEVIEAYTKQSDKGEKRQAA
ncbi:MAG: ABC transporter ATP-binding protein [Pirellulales bacterium]|nr:ABC transporter ATP-binding protein [Pirellulales bacterium]